MYRVKDKSAFFVEHVREYYTDEELVTQISYMIHGPENEFRNLVQAARELVQGGCFLMYYYEMDDLRQEFPGCIDGRLSAQNAWEVYENHVIRAICKIAKSFTVSPNQIHDFAKISMCEKFIDHHESDLYLKKIPASEFLVSRYEYPAQVSIFTDNIDHELWYDIPFAFHSM